MQRKVIGLSLSQDEIERLSAAAARTAHTPSGFATAMYRHAIAQYERIGSLEKLIAMKHRAGRVERISAQLQEQIHTALDLLFERAPIGIIEDVARGLTRRAGDYGQLRIPEPKIPRLGKAEDEEKVRR